MITGIAAAAFLPLPSRERVRERGRTQKTAVVLSMIVATSVF
jgi:hypothetical protein